MRRGRRFCSATMAVVVFMPLTEVGSAEMSRVATASGSSARDRALDSSVPILMYHHVAGAPPAGTRHPRLWVSASAFARQVDALAQAGYHGVTLGQVWRSWHEGRPLPANPIVFSFDDGYSSQYRNAAPTLRAQGWPGVLNLEVRRLNVDRGVTRAQVRRLIAAGWEVDAHTLTHPDLTRVDRSRLQREIAGSRTAIQHDFGVPVDFFCYPYGHFDATVKAAVRAAGFRAATTTRPRPASPSQDPYSLGRIGVSGRDSPVALLKRLHRAPSGGRDASG